MMGNSVYNIYRCAIAVRFVGYNSRAVKSLRRHKGFTLLEMMIVVAILGIVAALAYPSYAESVKETRRSDGMAELLQVMQQQERFFMNNRSYTIDLSDLGYAGATVESQNRMYTISAAACGGDIARCVQLTATPQGAMAGDGTILLDSRGERTATGNALTANVWG